MEGASLASWICASLMSVPTTFLKCSARKRVPCPDPQPTSTTSSAGFALCRGERMHLSGWSPNFCAFYPILSPSIYTGTALARHSPRKGSSLPTACPEPC